MFVPDNYLVEVGQEIVSRFQNYKPVFVAFWAKEQATEHGHLFIASDEITLDSIGDDYHEIGRLTNGDLDVSEVSMRIKLIPGASEMARTALSLQRRGQGVLPCRIQIGERMLGDTAIDGGLIYPALQPAVAESR